MIVESLKKSIMLSAISGNLSEQIVGEIVDNKLEDYSEEAQFIIPKNWKWVKLQDITDYGQNNSVSGNSLLESTWILELEDIEKNTGKLIQKVQKKDRKSVSNKNKFIKGNLLYGKLRPYLNKCIIANDDGYCSTEIVPMNLSENVIAKYLQIVFLSPYYYNFVNEKSYGTKMPRLGTNDAKNSLIPLPPLEEQRRIVNHLEIIYQKLDSLKPIEDELNNLKQVFPVEMRKSILNSAFNGKLISCSTQFSDWCSDKLIKVADILTGNSIPENIKKSKYTNVDNGFNYIATKDLGFDHSFNYENGIKIPFTEKNFKHANENDILMCIEGGSAGKKIGILSERVCFGNKLCKFSADSSKILPKYLYYYLQSPQFLQNFNSNLSGIIGGVSINKLKKIEIKYPTIKEQEEIISKIENLFLYCNNIEDLIGN